MKTVINNTKKPIRLRLPGGKTLFLGATKRQPVREEALEHPPVKKLIDSGDLVVEDGPGKQQGEAGSEGFAAKGSSQAQGGSRASLKSGDR